MFAAYLSELRHSVSNAWQKRASEDVETEEEMDAEGGSAHLLSGGVQSDAVMGALAASGGCALEQWQGGAVEC